MALPFFFQTGHFVVMAVTAVVMIRERVPSDGGVPGENRGRRRVARLLGA